MPINYGREQTVPEVKNPIEFSPAIMQNWLGTAKQAVKGEGEDILPTGWEKLSDMMAGKALFILDENLNQVTFMNPDFLRDQANAMEQMRQIMQASVDGRLFIRDTEGMMMQLKTTQNKDNSFTLDLSSKLNKIAGVPGDVQSTVQPPVKPARLSLLTYFLGLFWDKYTRQVEDYREKLAHYEGYQKGQVKVLPSAEERYQKQQEAEKAALKDNEYVERHKKMNEALAGEEKAIHAKEGLKPYAKNDIEIAFKNMATEQKYIPENSPIKLTPETMGVLVTLALASPDLTIKATQTNKETKEKVVIDRKNKPEEMYPRVMDCYVKNLQVTGSPINFVKAARNAVTAALNDAATGDYTNLGKLVADGLKLNNKLMQNQQELSNTFTVQAELGNKALKIMKNNPQLQAAVEQQLGEKSKVLDGVRAAKNISDLRVEATVAQRNLVSAFSSMTYQGNNKDVSTVAQAYFVEFEMKQGTLDLESSPYKDPKMKDTMNNELELSPVFKELREDKINRSFAITDGITMVQTYNKAILQKEHPPIQQNANVPTMNKQVDQVVEMQVQVPKT